jgi:diguanylate cyclase (GGDEF)-like protein
MNLFSTTPLLPPETLRSPWFLIFAAFVGVNTIIYMGLTLSKLVPWPKQVHPRRVRQMLGVAESDGLAAEPLEVRVSRESPADSAVHDIAGAFGWLGGVAMLLGSMSAFLHPGEIHDFVAMAIGLALLTIAQVMSRTKMSPRAATWLWTASASALALSIAFNISLGTLERLGYFLVLAVVVGAVALTWPSFIVGSLVVLGSYLALAAQVATRIDGDWFAPAVGAAIAGALLQVVRRRSLKILTDVDRLENQLGSTDVLTGALTRQGLITLGPTVRRAAQRVDRPVFAMIVDVEDLGGANRTYGTGYGDDLLRTVAEAMRTAARDADLLGRWSGDEFALIGMGGEDSIAALAERIPRIIAESPVTLGKTPLRVKMGTAVGTSAEHVEDIVERALADLTDAGAPDETDEAA